MAHEHAHGGHHDAAHAHWDTSVWPFVISFGILFMLPIAFAFHFAYHMPFAAILSLGIGMPMIVAGIVGWVNEAHTQGEGLSYGAMGWFILAEAMIFMSMFAGYWYMRLVAPVWPPAGTVELPKVMPLVMTAVLVASSFTVHYAEHLLHEGDKSGYVKWLLITIVLGACFLGMSAYEWNHLFHEGFSVKSNVFGTVFFSITGLHGSHVIVGLCIFLAALKPALSGALSMGFARTAGLYWHFVDIIWFFVVSQVYYW
ncbi:MAG TPA: heme-copper oxidase subunit III [Rhodocyclaceae bacterium]|nr:heme-copper oxidase subunit III [Rhodocyclaceae bacterium]HNH35224.1 heme-copper oxidase subunit III [Rhodocyclaceae bacterium]